jgi:hypothetical protein
MDLVNGRTLAVLVKHVPVHDFPGLFARFYGDFAGVLRSVDEPALVVVAIDEARERVAGILRLPARPGALAGAAIGRHDRADLCLDGDESLSLRQLAVLVDPSRGFRRGAEVAYRLIDLRTGTGFTDEHHRPLAAVRCEGTAFFRCGRFALLMLAAGDPSDWPEDAGDAWSMIPERVFFDERAPRVAPPPAAAPRPTTMVTATFAARHLDELDAGDAPAGIVELRGARLRIGRAALREGVLLGRYDRCAAAHLVDDDTVSRTHLLLIEVGGRRCALDTGSTNGTWHDGRPARLVALRDGIRLRLGYHTEVTWTEL